jgi:hypothetical protein
VVRTARPLRRSSAWDVIRPIRRHGRGRRDGVRHRPFARSSCGTAFHRRPPEASLAGIHRRKRPILLGLESASNARQTFGAPFEFSASKWIGWSLLEQARMRSRQRTLLGIEYVEWICAGSVSATGAPSSACLSAKAICASLNFDRFIANPPSPRPILNEKFQLRAVQKSGCRSLGLRWITMRKSRQS